MKNITVLEVRSWPVGVYGVGRGLYIQKTSQEGGKWFFRYRLHGRRRPMGLGGWPDISLKVARERADDARQLVKAGIDPIDERRKGVAQTKHLFEDVAYEAYEAKQASLKGGGKNGRWFSPLEIHVLPKIGKMPITHVDQNVIRDALKTLWAEKYPTATKAMDRIGIVIKHASAMGLDVDVQATAKAKELLGKSGHKVTSIPMMPYAEVPAFYKTLCPDDPAELSPTKLLLRLLILTGIRTNAVRHMHLDEIKGDVWTAPGPNLKGGKDAVPDYRVPLTDEMLKVIELATPFTRNGYLFTGPKGKPIADVNSSRYMAERDLKARPHGFRTTLRTWISERTDTPWEIAEFIVEHDRRDVVAKVYDQTDYLEKRRPIMQRYSDFVTGRSTIDIAN